MKHLFVVSLFRFRSSKSGKIYLHRDVRLLFSEESQWKLIAVLHMNSNLTLNRQQTSVFTKMLIKSDSLKYLPSTQVLKVKIIA